MEVFGMTIAEIKPSCIGYVDVSAIRGEVRSQSPVGWVQRSETHLFYA